MANYVVVHTHLKHGIEDEADIYLPGEEIELTEKEARQIGDNVRPAKKGAGRGIEIEDREEQPASEEAGNLEDRTNAELIAMLEGKVEIPKKARKAELIELVKQSSEKS
jgi:hypothetical protein